MHFYAMSDAGKIRTINQDFYKIIDTDNAGFFVIADGMGGHNSGEIASKLAVDAVYEYIMKNILLGAEEGFIGLIREAMLYSNSVVFEKARCNKSMNGMGTTMILAAVSDRNLYIGHIGDSRAYIIREKEIKQLTTDHSFIEELIRSGTITRDEAESHPRRNVITKALGCFEEIQIDTLIMEIKNGDILILCTDGLTKSLNDEKILDTASITGSPDAICRELIKAANDNGGEDNITVVVASL